MSHLSCLFILYILCALSRIGGLMEHKGVKLRSSITNSLCFVIKHDFVRIHNELLTNLLHTILKSLVHHRRFQYVEIRISTLLNTGIKSWKSSYTSLKAISANLLCNFHSASSNILGFSTGSGLGCFLQSRLFGVHPYLLP